MSRRVRKKTKMQVTYNDSWSKKCIENLNYDIITHSNWVIIFLPFPFSNGDKVKPLKAALAQSKGQCVCEDGIAPRCDNDEEPTCPNGEALDLSLDLVPSVLSQCAQNWKIKIHFLKNAYTYLSHKNWKYIHILRFGSIFIFFIFQFKQKFLYV